MRVRGAWVVVPLLLSWGVAGAETIDALLQAFYGPDGLPDKSAAYTGEMADRYRDRATVGEQTPPGMRMQSRPLYQGDKEAVYATTLTDAATTEDWYTFLRFEQGRWKLAAVRRPLFDGAFWNIFRELEQRHRRSDDEAWALQNMRLTTQSDAELRRYFLDNRELLTTIASRLLAGQRDEAVRLTRQLFLAAAKLNARAGWVEIVIGGIGSRGVGFLFIPQGSHPPAMTPDRTILVEHLEGSWYLFRTL
ncbi:MAG: hypothetical protein HQL66_01870 [Magnetococcales bacterium]|nr:hypothetical protein [Magnetococcales bacterium]